MIKIILHCGDIHIPMGTRRHSEYKEVLDNFLIKVKEITADYEFGEVAVLIAGDLLHNKLEISNEMNVLVSDFLQELNTIALTLLITGNHDKGINSDRVDSITPIIKMLKLKNVRYLDMELEYKSGFMEIDNVIFCLYSIFDDYNLQGVKVSKINNPDKLHIGLFHGCLDGSVLDSTFTLGGINKELFDGCQLVLMADIHKRQFIDLNGVTLCYCGSLHQNSFGESRHSHGFIEWNIEDPEDITYVEHDIDEDNEFGFYKFKISSVSELEEGVEEFVNF